MKAFRIVVDTFEPGAPYPILTHTFTGRDEAQAAAFLRAHLTTDEFFRECVKGQWRKVRCRNVVRSRGWVNT